MFVHINFRKEHPALRTPVNPSIDEWVSIAQEYYRVAYNYYEKEEEETAWIAEQKKWLSDNVPETMRKGTFLLEAGGGFMGENVWAVDGEICHTLHITCSHCRTYSVVPRAFEGEPLLWCISCALPFEYAEEKTEE
jgi:hypothetical protein